MTHSSILDALGAVADTPVEHKDLLATLRRLAAEEDASAAEAPDAPRRLAASSPPEASAPIAAGSASPEAERMPWPNSWFSTNDPADGARCRNLWASVLTSCLIGALTDRLDRKRRADVPESWIGSASFQMICEMAGFDATAIEDRVRAKMETDEGAEYLRRDLSGRLPRRLHAQRADLTDGEG
ncbi:hypothetical protein [Limimaricola hongkongensis]|uniref:Uncharacterized protein n=1 Tax=Limimaricola hongkongensis DSM 17492 TaxID=1122180 RepID=A0A017HBN0_9RHOB|nr:hypothetical protein [Limimaricola hongkongensis]EYD71786.1 hypothetical protein Lokhon_01856 [Limimaricola hongkongensis DSM 17492]